MKGFEVEGRCSDNKAEECPFRKAKLAGSRHRFGGTGTAEPFDEGRR